MSWLPKGNGRNRYYYRRVRYGSRVRSQYVGHGAPAQFVAETDALRQAERKVWQAGKARLLALEAEMKMLEKGCAVLMEAVLLPQGIHKLNDRSSWRKRRNVRRSTD